MTHDDVTVNLAIITFQKNDLTENMYKISEFLS